MNQQLLLESNFLREFKNICYSINYITYCMITIIVIKMIIGF